MLLEITISKFNALIRIKIQLGTTIVYHEVNCQSKKFPK